MGITSVLVEGGATPYSFFHKENLVDKLLVFQAPLIIGGDGINSIGILPIDQLEASSTVQISFSRGDRRGIYSWKSILTLEKEDPHVYRDNRRGRNCY